MKRFTASLIIGLIGVGLAGCQTGPLANFSKSILGPVPERNQVSAYEQQLPTRAQLTDQPKSAGAYTNYGTAPRLGYQRGNLPCQT